MGVGQNFVFLIMEMEPSLSDGQASTTKLHPKLLHLFCLNFCSPHVDVDPASQS